MSRSAGRLAFPLALALGLVVSLLASPTAGWAAETAPAAVVVAIDTSRSLSPADVASIREGLAGLLAGLPAESPLGLLTFNDQATWDVPPGSTQAAITAGLGALATGGNYTLLYDGLITAARGLPEGGGLLLVTTDGRDENSATTLEDVARLCSARGVRIATLGVGRADEKILRRLALLTAGSYLGPLPRLDLGAGAREIDHLRGEIESAARAKAAAARPAPALPSAPVTTAPAPAPPTIPAATAWPVVAGIAVLAAAILAGLLFSKSRRKAPGTFDEQTRPGTFKLPAPTVASPPLRCPNCGGELDPQTGRCPNCGENELIQSLRATAIAGRSELKEVSPDDTASVMRLPYSESIEHTFVLDEESVLVVYAPGETARSYRLPAEHAVAIGRDAQKNTLAFPDPTLSGTHFRLVPDGLAFHVLDLDSTNGVFINGQRARHALLKPGDRLRAGLEEFEFRTHQQQLA